MEEKYSKILPLLLSSTATDPIEIQNSIMNESFVSPNGPEHHLQQSEIADIQLTWKNA